MFRFLPRAAFFFSCLLLVAATSAQTNLPNTLLWRISGKGLSQPSYLFGTMHLQDKRLFQFGDSLYRALEQTEGFAIEVDVREYMDSVLINAFKDAETEGQQKLKKIAVNRKNIGKTGDSLLRKFGIKGNVLTKKELKKIRDYRMAGMLRQGEMPTIVDAYLLGLAQRQGKWTGGIEDVSDQLNLSNELGGALEPETVLQNENLFQSSIDQMINLYLKQDLQGIYNYCIRSYSEESIDAVLNRRNRKMAFRMDSLAHLRSMFFAVGAAHLPGSTGVVALLKEQGYKVEPVFSSTKIPADVYAAGLRQRDWLPVTGIDEAYTVQMPGKPTLYDAHGGLLKMQMFFDITTMTFYMAGHITGSNVMPPQLEAMMKEMGENMGVKSAAFKITTLQADSIYGKEAYLENEAGNYRVQLLLKGKVVYLLMVGGMKKEALNSADVSRFYKSFVAGNRKLQERTDQPFVLEDKSFSVRMPVKPMPNPSLNQQATGTNWTMVSYNGVDEASSIYYLVQVRELREGLYLDGDSAYFNLIEEEYKARIDELLQAKRDSHQGYPVLLMEGYLKESNAVYKTMHLTRGNRAYILMAGIPKGAQSPHVDTFFSSFTLLPNKDVKWERQAISGFFADAPSPFQKRRKDSTDKSLFYSESFYAGNAANAVSYEVTKEVFSPTYWATNDSTYFNSRVGVYKNYSDSLLKKEWVQNGGAKGMEIRIQMPGYNSLKQVRQLVSGDTLYTLFSMIPRQEIDKPEHQVFFNSFRLATEQPPAVYTPKPAPLLAALQTTDSLLFADAKENLDLVTFEKSHLPLLHQALLHTYQNTDEYSSVNDKLVDIISEFSDSSTLGFVAQEYFNLSGNKEKLRYPLLSLLAKIKTTASYQLLNQLLGKGLPSAGNSNPLYYALFDSLSLSAQLYPQLLQGASDVLFGRSLVAVANRLVDSSMLKASVYQSYRLPLLKGARQAAVILKKEADEAWMFNEWSRALGHLNSVEGNALLRSLLTQKDTYLKQTIILALLKNNGTVAPAEIAKVAADKTQRGSFYEGLKELKKESLVPAAYATAKSLAESELYNYLSEDYEDFTLTYIGQREETFNGKRQVFQLFTVRMYYDYEDRKQTFLAVAGPYDSASKTKSAYTEASGFYTEEEYTPAKAGRLLKDYLKTMEPGE